MAVKILVHGSGHKASSWKETVAYMPNHEEILCPNLSSILEGKRASYENLYASFVQYCNRVEGPIHICGLSLLQYRSEEHTSELQSHSDIVCRLLLEKKKEGRGGRG